MKKNLIFFFLLALVQVTYSQSTNICDQILRYGIFDYYELKSETNFDYVFKKLVSMDREELEYNYRNRTLDADIPIPLAEGFLNIGINAGDEEERYKKLKELYINNQETSIKYQDKTWLLSKVANKDIINAWSKCVSNPKDLFIEVQGSLKDTFSLTLTFKPDLPRTKDTKFTGVTAQGVKLEGNQVFKKNNRIKKNNTYTQKFVRTSPNEASVVLNLDYIPYALTITIPAIPKPIPKYEVKWFRQDESGNPYYKDTPQIGISCNCNTSGEFQLNEKNSRIYDVSYSCYGSGCGWSYNPAGGYGASIRIAGDGQSFLWFRIWQGVPATEVYRVFYEKQRGVCVKNCEDKQALTK